MSVRTCLACKQRPQEDQWLLRWKDNAESSPSRDDPSFRKSPGPRDGLAAKSGSGASDGLVGGRLTVLVGRRPVYPGVGSESLKTCAAAKVYGFHARLSKQTARQGHRHWKAFRRHAGGRAAFAYRSSAAT